MPRPKKGEYRDALIDHITEEGGGHLYTGERLRDLRSAIESICDKIAGQWVGPVTYPDREYPWSSPRAALSEIVAIAKDGYAMASVCDPDRLKFANAFGVGSAVRAGAIDTGHRRVERVREVLMSLEVAYPTGYEGLTGDQCRTLLLYRFGQGKDLGSTVDEARNLFGVEVTSQQVSNITRHGLSIVREYLQRRALIPTGGDNVSGEALPWDLLGWEEISEALGCDPQTSKKYQRQGMPIYKFNGRVVAVESEITAWLRDQAGMCRGTGRKQG